MTESVFSSVILASRRAASRVQLSARALVARIRHRRVPRPPLYVARHGRRIAIALGVVCALISILGGAVWWRLSTGPLSMDVVTPWLISALEERLGGGYRVEVGGTVLERDEEGRTALRLRDVVLRDRAGSVVASAPKAEVGIAASGLLLSGGLRAERLSLIGAQMAVRIERNGQLTVFAGAPAAASAVADTGGATAAAPLAVSPVAPASPVQDPADEPATNLFATVVAWLQSLDAGGLDGHNLMEIGLKSGSIAVDDRRTGRQANFGNINLGLTRLANGGVAFAVNSTGADGPWSINATVTSQENGRRAVEAVVRDVSPKDILLAFRLDSGNFQADVPLSAAVRADMGADGTLNSLHGRVLAGAGYIGDTEDREARILIDEAQAELRWDAEKRLLTVPLEIHSGANRIALMTGIEPPREPGGRWAFSVSRGMVVLTGSERSPPLILDRISARAMFDATKRRIEVEQADLRGASGGVALSGALEYSESGSRVMVGIAGTRMPVSAFKRIWPALVSPTLRSWVEKNLLSGTVEKIEIAVNAPVANLMPSGPPLTPEGLSVDILVRGAEVTPVEGLPPAKNVDIATRVVGGNARLSFGTAQIDLPSGRTLNVSGGTFDVTEIGAALPAGRANVAMDGPVEGAVELLGMEPLKNAAVLPFDTEGARGEVTAQVMLSLPLVKELPPGSVQYAVQANLTNFAADKFFRGQKAEASNLQINAGHDSVWIKGEMKIAGTPAAIEYRKTRQDPEAELRVQATLDDGARARLGLDFDNKLNGPITVKLGGRTNVLRGEGRLAIEADLTQAKVSELLPGWIKPAGRQARASFVLVDGPQSKRLEEFALDGSGTHVRGSVELGSSGEILRANLPNFAVADGDKASLKAERTGDGVLKVVLRGDLYDGRGLVKTAVAGQKPELRGPRPQDIDLDIKLGAITGYHGEALRNFELRMSRRGGQIRSFNLSGGIGGSGKLAGEMRNRGNSRVLYVETTDAGALFRFSDIYARIVGGALWIAMEPPTHDSSPQEGLFNIRDFVVRGEPALDRVAAGASSDERNQGGPSVSGGVQFSRMRVEFTRSPGRFSVRDGVVWGASIGATVDGSIDYFRDEVRLRGTFVPAYGLNNMFSRLPVVGMFLGGGANEGLFGITYQVVGTPRAPVLQVNPMSAVAPGFLRKLFEFRGGQDQSSRGPEPVR